MKKRLGKLVAHGSCFLANVVKESSGGLYQISSSKVFVCFDETMFDDVKFIRAVL